MIGGDGGHRLGVGLWTMQSTVHHPANLSRLYAEFAEDAAIVEAHGLDSVWTAQHRAWYDGWCPAPLHALAYVAARTSRVRLGTAVLLLPQQDPVAIAMAAATLVSLSEGRLELGVGLGYREAEFDLIGVPKRRRGRLMEEGLDRLAELGPGGPPVWVGGMADRAIDRAARRGHGLMLPQTVSPERLRAIVERYRRTGSRYAPIGVLRDVRIEPDPGAAARFRTQLQAHYREEIEAWWPLGGTAGAVERQLGFVARAALVGDAAHVTHGLADLRRAGATAIVARLNFPFVERSVLHAQIAALARL